MLTAEWWVMSAWWVGLEAVQLLRSGTISDQEVQGFRELSKRSDPVALLATMSSCQPWLEIH